MSRIIEATDPFIFQTILYPAGEIQVRVRPESLELVGDVTGLVIRGADPATLVQGIMAYDALDQAMTELSEPQHFYYRAALVLPYMPYGRADRRFTPGDCFGLKTFLNMADESPIVYTLDVHGAIPPGYGVKNISPASIMQTAAYHVRDTTGRDPVILLPDAGALARYAAMFPSYRVYNATKRRDEATGQLLGFNVPTLPPGAPVLIVDDICDGGGTFLGIIKELFENPALRTTVHLHVTHGVFSNNAVGRLHAAGFTSVTSTDSLPSAGGDEFSQGADRLFPCLPVIQAFMEK